MFYEINVSLNGSHLFATAERSITSEYQLERAYNILKVKFPKEEGYRITVTKFETIGKGIDME